MSKQGQTMYVLQQCSQIMLYVFGGKFNIGICYEATNLVVERIIVASAFEFEVSKKKFRILD